MLLNLALPFTSKVCVGVTTPIPILPLLAIRNASVAEVPSIKLPDSLLNT
jgi:hypothetical protein